MPPAGRVGDQDGGAQVDLGLIENPPAAGSPHSTAEGAAQGIAEQGIGPGLSGWGLEVGVELPAQALPLPVLRRGEVVLVADEGWCGLRHGASPCFPG